MSEVTAELDAMQEECLRLRTMLEENLKNNQNKEKDDEIELLKNEIKLKDDENRQMRSDNTTMAQAWKDKDNHIKTQAKHYGDLKQRFEKQK